MFSFLKLKKHSPEELERELRLEHWVVGIIFLCIVLFGIFYYFFIHVAAGFQSETVVSIQSGESLDQISRQLADQHVVSSAFWFSNLVILQGGEHKLVAGDYIFHSGNSLFKVSRRVMSGDFENTPIKVTFPEGSDTYADAAIMSKKFASFDPVTFIQLAKPDEGYLFPDTYFLFATVQPDTLISIMEANFHAQVDPLLPAVATSGRSLKDIITMASILEEEGKTTQDRQIIAGILWKRIDSGKNLQIDSPFQYILGKTSSELTVTDLKIDSPYNTYLYPGLPPTPISSPGLNSINAALHPIATPYWFFISDSNGDMHYATTFAQHEANIKKYLR